jgi:hypothetical protein
MNHKHTGIGTVLMFLMWSSIAILGSGPQLSDMVSRVIEKSASTETPWKFITAEEVTMGVSLPSNTNIVFTMPMAISPSGKIALQALVGSESTSIRFYAPRKNVPLSC